MSGGLGQTILVTSKVRWFGPRHIGRGGVGLLLPGLKGRRQYQRQKQSGDKQGHAGQLDFPLTFLTKPQQFLNNSPLAPLAKFDE